MILYVIYVDYKPMVIDVMLMVIIINLWLSHHTETQRNMSPRYIAQLLLQLLGRLRGNHHLRNTSEALSRRKTMGKPWENHGKTGKTYTFFILSFFLQMNINELVSIV
jgi:hypothetical protein